MQPETLGSQLGLETSLVHTLLQLHLHLRIKVLQHELKEA